MVHSKLISEGKVVPLTFRQLKILEKMDAEKEREAKLLELGKEGVIAVGRGAQGIFSNQIAGTIAFFLILASNPALLQIAYNNVQKLMKLIGDGIKGGLTDPLGNAAGINNTITINGPTGPIAVPIPPSGPLQIPFNIAAVDAAGIQFAVQAWQAGLTDWNAFNDFLRAHLRPGIV